MYEPTWITSQLAAGAAPMSYDDLEAIRQAGITAMLNLCGEFSDLHLIEEQAGFEVYYLPVPDEHAPAMDEMERALAWLDEAIYLNKKVLVHCRHGHGRTGTLISAYLVRKGLGLKKAEKILKNTRANPTNYSQWKLLKKYNRKQGVLTSASPSMENRTSVDLSPFLAEVGDIAEEVSRELEQAGHEGCGQGELNCCYQYFELELAEAIFLHTRSNEMFAQDQRILVRDRAREYQTVIRTVRALHCNCSALAAEPFETVFAAAEHPCPLLSGDRCQAFAFRPLRCRWYGSGFDEERQQEVSKRLIKLSENIYLALTGSFFPRRKLVFSMADTVSGRYVQACFQAMNHREKRDD